MNKKLSWLDWLFVGLLIVVFGGIVLHAPVSVALSSAWPDYAPIIKAWKEIVLGGALIACVVILTTRKQWGLVRTRLIGYIALFAALNIVLIPAFQTGFEAVVAGLFINLRYLLFFVLVYVALRLYPHVYRLFLTTFVVGAVVVTGFAILQVTVLPHDILKYLGYGKETIMPYLTVDQNINYIRINSTLRGPNPLGIYAVVALTVVLVAWLRRTREWTRREQVVGGIIAAGSVVALWASYSRSAIVAAAIALAIAAIVLYGKRVSRKIWLAVAIIALILTGGVVAFRETQFVSQVILHEDPHQGSNAPNSNDGHLESLADGTARLIRQPLGAGIGSTGSASLLTDKPLIIENQYLFIAHETGWLGLALFVLIYVTVLREAWRRRAQWLALAVFASGVGIAAAGLVLPVWVDDTVSIVWWGLAAMVVASPLVITKAQGSVKKRKAI